MTPAAAGLSVNPLGNHIYQGRYHDPETGLYYFRNRYHHPALGRFLERDPIGYDGGMNLYEFEAGMPMTAVDPYGEAWFIPFVIYAGVQAAWSLAETVVEAAAAYALGDDDFSFGVSFAKNFGINLATGGIGGKVKAGTTVLRTMGKQAGLWGLRQTMEISADTAFDVGYYGRDFQSALLINSIGSIAGEGIARGIGAGLRRGVGLPRRGVAGPDTIYSRQGNFETIVREGRIWGKTEGSVWGMGIPNAPPWRTWERLPIERTDPGMVVFHGEAARLFAPKQAYGMFSLAKRGLGQYKAGFGDIEILAFEQVGKTLHVTAARLGRQAAERRSGALYNAISSPAFDWAVSAGLLTGYSFATGLFGRTYHQ